METLTFAPEAVVGDYRLLEAIGVGGMGVAYRAFDMRLKRTVAIKTLRTDIADDPATKRRLLREARAAAALSHPNICTIFTVAESAGVPFIVMEYVPGRTLDDVIRDGPMEPARVASLALQVADALRAAHAMGIVHRDVKPANIVLGHDGQVKVLDFGLALIAHAEGTPPSSLTMTSVTTEVGVAAGTVAYMSPEQASGEAVDARSDLFSLGIVLYELCTARNPFQGPNVLATLARVMTAPVAPCRDSIPDFPAHLDDVIQRCLAKRAEDRYASASDVVRDLSGGTASPLWRSRDVHGIPSVAVLPFRSLNRRDREELLADGLATELTSRLAKSGQVLVISRTSTMRFRDSQEDARLIGHRLNVKALVEGTVRETTNGCVVTVNLTDVANGYHIWSQDFAVPEELALDLAPELARSITRVLHVTDAAARRKSTEHESRRALEGYLRAVHAYHKFSSADNLVAIEILRRLSQEAPTYAKAHALLASACLARIERGWELDATSWLGEAHRASEEALRLDDSLSEAYSARAAIAFFAKQHDSAEADVREALRADENNDIAHNLLGRIRFARGEFLGAIASYRDALAINPYSVWCLNDLAWAVLLTGDEAESERIVDRVLEISPDDEGGRCGKAAFRSRRGEAAAALSDVQRAQATNPYYPFVSLLFPAVLLDNGMADEAIAAGRRLVASGAGAYFGHAGLGLAYGVLGDEAGMNEQLEQALSIVPFYPAFNLTYAGMYEFRGLRRAAARWIRKGVEEGVRLVEVSEWHPSLRRLCEESGLIPTGRGDA